MDRNCEKTKELLPLFSGGDVEENERIAVEGHLSVCAECVRESEVYFKARKELSFLREGPMPEVDLWSGVSAKLFPRKKGPSRLEWIVRYAAVVVMGLGVGFLVTTGSSSPSEEVPVSSQSERIPVVDSGESMLGEADFAGTGGPGSELVRLRYSGNKIFPSGSDLSFFRICSSRGRKSS